MLSITRKNGILIFVNDFFSLGEMKPEQVLNLEQVSQQKIEFDHENMKQKSGWTVQRIRLSPQEKHLAATVTTKHREEPMWEEYKIMQHIEQKLFVCNEMINDCPVTIQVCGCEAWKGRFPSSGTPTHHIYSGQSPQLWYIFCNLINVF